MPQASPRSGLPRSVTASAVLTACLLGSSPTPVAADELECFSAADCTGLGVRAEAIDAYS